MGVWGQKTLLGSATKRRRPPHRGREEALVSAVTCPVWGTKETDGQALSLRDQGEEGDLASVKGIQEAASG